MLSYVYSVNNGVTGIEKGIVFVEHEWEVTIRLGTYYNATEEELIASGLNFTKIDNLEELRNQLDGTDLVTFI